MRLTLAGPTLKRCSNLFQTNLWQGSRLIAETDNDKHWQTYLYEPDSYRPLALVHGNAQQDNIKLYWYQNDHLGTPIALTSNMGDTLYECQYNAYGQIINEIYHQDDFHALPDNPLRFQGQYYDEETGLHYNLNRYYDPFTGRYITQDPLGILGGLNSYQYAGSDPINWIDPLGLIKVENNGFEGVAGTGIDIVKTEKLAIQAQQELINEINKFGSKNQAAKNATMVGAYDPVTGQIAIGSSNANITAGALHPRTVEYIETQLGVKIGEFTSFCKNKAGACAEVSGADKLIRMGSNPENIKFTDALRPRDVWGKNYIPPAAVILPCQNCRITWPKGKK
ncbi:hypothetical protein A9G35_06815 [Gilliamella sp. Choc5-1]|uniref:RHS repeat-associated core domain-containing protein n=1 Tax=Gilliamella sp. Choc5-1 TaxID=3120238 RepID=UPI00080E231F|nr:RHS repeat-associated core domain-containing protein [Gilliamella apicola]OCG45186.1 hypothetical protein A9G35_06815 [Gilliamella apicola]